MKLGNPIHNEINDDIVNLWDEMSMNVAKNITSLVKNIASDSIEVKIHDNVTDIIMINI
jgi:ribosomal protein L9